MNVRRVAAAAIATAALVFGISPTAASAEEPPFPHGPFDASREATLTVHSAAMNRDVTVYVIKPADTSRPKPVLYLLDGMTRASKTDDMAFLASKDAYIVVPTGGENAWWTDWERPDPKLGVNKWTTFLSRELPPVIASRFPTNGRNAVAGMSRTGSAALALAIQAPGLYKSVASYSSCPNTSGPFGETFIRASMSEYGGGNPDNMWGPSGSADWIANDAYVNAEKLRGTDLFVSAGSGLPGPHEIPAPGQAPDVGQIFVGGGIEVLTGACTTQFAQRLQSLGIPATIDTEPVGTHAWPYWSDALHKSWPVLAHGLGIS